MISTPLTRKQREIDEIVMVVKNVRDTLNYAKDLFFQDHKTQYKGLNESVDRLGLLIEKHGTKESR